MDVVSTCPIRVGSLLWQPRAGAFALTVICKATYRLLPLESPLADTQDPIHEADTSWDGDARSSLSAATDLVPFKRWADIMLVGHAYAPAKQPVSSLLARVTIGTWTKAVEVHADRTWTFDGTIQVGPPFVSMPLWWERAAGGPGTSIPVGMPTGGPLHERSRRALPNLQPPGLHIRGPDDAIPPAGFGPIAPLWPDRMAKLHRHAAAWNPRTWSQKPLPDDIDSTFFNAAPPDQQLDQIPESPLIILENLLQDYPRLTTSLTRVSPRAHVQRPGAGDAEIRLRCDTLLIDTDRAICAVSWRAAVPLKHPSEQGKIVVTAEITAVNPSLDLTSTLVTKLPDAAIAQAKPVLPFINDPSRSAAFQSGKPDLAPQRPAPEISVQPDSGTGPMTARIATGAPLEDPLPFTRTTLPQAMRTEPLEPPPLLGRDRAAPAPSSPPPPEAPPTPAPPEATHEEPPPEPEPAAFQVERFAAIAAEIAEQRAPRAEVLRDYGLTERAWASLERHYADALEKDAARGSQELQAASDRAYVAAVEGFRGPIAVTDYARILVGMERRRAKEALDELKIQRPALMPIVRLWTKKIAADAKLSKNVMALLAKLRAA